MFRCFWCAEPLVTVKSVVITRTLKSNVYKTLAGVAFSQHTVEASPDENLFMQFVLLSFIVLVVVVVVSA